MRNLRIILNMRMMRIIRVMRIMRIMRMMRNMRMIRNMRIIRDIPELILPPQNTTDSTPQNGVLLWGCQYTPIVHRYNTPL